MGVYAIDKVVAPDPVDTVYIANGCGGERVVVDMNGAYRVRVLDCRGREVWSGEQAFAGITPIPVPSGGLVVLTK